MSMGKLKSNRIGKPSNSDSMSSISSAVTAAAIDNDTSSNTTYPIVRRRISKACNYCRQRKIKCNGTSPCLNCKNHHIECTYSKTIRKKKKQTTKKLTLQDLEKRMNKMDQKFDYINEKLTSVLDLLTQHGLSKKINKKQQQKLNNDNIVSSDEEEEDEEEIEEGEEEEVEEDGELQSVIDDEDDVHLLSPLSEYSSTNSNNESLSSTDQPEEFMNNDHLDILNTSNSAQLPTQTINTVPLESNNYTMGNYNSILDSVPFDQHNNLNGFDFNLIGNGADSKLNYLYSEVPMLNGQSDSF